MSDDPRTKQRKENAMDYALFRLALNIHASDMFDNYEQLYELDVD